MKVKRKLSLLLVSLIFLGANVAKTQLAASVPTIESISIDNNTNQEAVLVVDFTSSLTSSVLHSFFNTDSLYCNQLFSVSFYNSSIRSTEKLDLVQIRCFLNPDLVNFKRLFITVSKNGLNFQTLIRNFLIIFQPSTSLIEGGSKYINPTFNQLLRPNFVTGIVISPTIYLIKLSKNLNFPFGTNLSAGCLDYFILIEYKNNVGTQALLASETCIYSFSSLDTSLIEISLPRSVFSVNRSFSLFGTASPSLKNVDDVLGLEALTAQPVFGDLSLTFYDASHYNIIFPRTIRTCANELLHFGFSGAPSLNGLVGLELDFGRIVYVSRTVAFQILTSDLITHLGGGENIVQVQFSIFSLATNKVIDFFPPVQIGVIASQNTDALISFVGYSSGDNIQAFKSSKVTLESQISWPTSYCSPEINNIVSFGWKIYNQTELLKSVSNSLKIILPPHSLDAGVYSIVFHAVLEDQTILFESLSLSIVSERPVLILVSGAVKNIAVRENKANLHLDGTLSCDPNSVPKCDSSIGYTDYASISKIASDTALRQTLGLTLELFNVSWKCSDCLNIFNFSALDSATLRLYQNKLEITMLPQTVVQTKFQFEVVRLLDGDLTSLPVYVNFINLELCNELPQILIHPLDNRVNANGLTTISAVIESFSYDDSMSLLWQIFNSSEELV